MRDAQIVVDELTIFHLDEEWAVPCDIPGRRQMSPGGWPHCSDEEPAAWIAWKHCPCNQGPRYMLICDTAKQVYESWMAQGASFVCAWCEQPFETGPNWVTPLNGKAA